MGIKVLLATLIVGKDMWFCKYVLRFTPHVYFVRNPFPTESIYGKTGTLYINGHTIFYIYILVVINLEVSVETKSEEECLLSEEETGTTWINL